MKKLKTFFTVLESAPVVLGALQESGINFEKFSKFITGSSKAASITRGVLRASSIAVRPESLSGSLDDKDTLALKKAIDASSTKIPPARNVRNRKSS
jgi:hypothetical protein